MWTVACVAELRGRVPRGFAHHCRAPQRCPAPGRLPDASQGPQHLRDVFYRMGFNDQEIVALSGAHTLGRCHVVRSGYDGPWTTNPLRFDNQYFRNLLNLKWVEKKWDGPKQFVDALTGELMMLPTDMALVQDASFKQWVEKYVECQAAGTPPLTPPQGTTEREGTACCACGCVGVCAHCARFQYAADEPLFFEHFSAAFAKLLALGCPEACDPASTTRRDRLTPKQEAGAHFREHAMHGSVGLMRKFAPNADMHEREVRMGCYALGCAALHSCVSGHHAAHCASQSRLLGPH